MRTFAHFDAPLLRAAPPFSVRMPTHDMNFILYMCLLVIPSDLIQRDRMESEIVASDIFALESGAK